ncbi:MAG: type III pantothenate kinase [Proteobacteria bacterium]|nr:type III pantothenate kinase [Pseudomonadota bacterium]MBU1711078.1 type III pantothenate kinase [Pseudomonadota bacterium]
MLLAIDVGNTHMVIGVFDQDRILCQWRVKTDRDSTADELASLFHDLFTLKKMHFTDITDVIIASVVPPMQSAWAKFTEKYLSLRPLLVSNTMKTGMKILIDSPKELGADRIVNAVAAYEKYHAALVVVDFGTAITFDCISAKGEYLGGAIAPGIAISLDALDMRTAKLPRVDISSPPQNAIGKNTVEAIKSGILFGYGSMVDGLISKISKELQPDIPKVIATGGMAELIAPYAKTIESVEPHLTLEGLYLLYERNRP